MFQDVRREVECVACFKTSESICKLHTERLSGYKFLELLSTFKKKIESITFMNRVKDREDKRWQMIMYDHLF